MVKRRNILILLVAISLNCYSQSSTLIQLVAKYQKARVELERINPYETPDLCVEKSSQIIDLFNQIHRLDSTQIQPIALFEPYSMAAYSYYGKKNLKSALPYLVKAKNIALDYTNLLLHKGYTYDALLGIAVLLRDAYTDTGDYDNAIIVSREIVSAFEKINPKHLAFQQMAESQVYKAKDDISSLIESDNKALNYFELYGNDVQGFYVETIVNEILEGYLYSEDYLGALSFIDDNRERLNALFQGKEDLEFEKLNQTNKYLFQVYQHIGLYQRAANAAILVSNYCRLANGDYSPNYAVWLNNAACSYMDMYGTEDNVLYLNKADTLFNVVGEIWHSIPNYEQEQDYATYLGNYGNLLSHKKEFDKAEVCLHKSLSLYQQLGCEENYILSAKSRLATLYGDAGRIEESISLHKELLDKYGHRKDTLQIARICNLLSQLYWIDMNNDEMGEKYANKAYEVLYQAKVRNELTATVTENLSRIYYRLGLEDRALQYSKESLDIKETLGIAVSPYELLNAREFFLDSYSDLFFYYPEGKESVVDHVESYCNYILKQNSGDTRENKKLCWKAKTVLGKAYMFFHRFDDAEKQFQDVLTLEENLWGKNSSNYVTTLNNLAYCYSLQRDYEKCRNYSLECIKYEPTHKNYENVLSSSIALDDLKMVEEYLPLTFNTSLNYLKSQFLYLGTEQREELIEDGGTFGFSNFALPASIYPQSKICTGYAYNSALVSKGLLLSTEKDVESIISTTPNVVLKSNWQNLKALQKQLHAANDSVNIWALRRTIELKEKEILSVLHEYADFTKNLNLDWQGVQKQLEDHDVAIEFVEYNYSPLTPTDTTQYYGAVVLKREWDAPKFIPLSKTIYVDTIIKNIIGEFDEKEEKGYNEEMWQQVSHKLFEDIWHPIMHLINQGDKVFFSPIGLLHLAPLEILSDNNDKPISRKCELYRVSSTKQLCLPTHQKYIGNAVLYGGLKFDTTNSTIVESAPNGKREGWQYLPSTAEEVDDIAGILKDNHVNSLIYKNSEGTEESFKALSGKEIPFLHIATHGFYFDEANSGTYQFFKDMNLRVKRGGSGSTLLRSGLMLSGGQKAWLQGQSVIPQGLEDGILLASEISLLDLHNIDLVVLSACQTGLGDISSDGVMGLQRGFKRAGVNSLLMTLWPVSDSATQILMKQFYQCLMVGQTKRQALISSQKYLREYNNGDYNEPYYWAAFILLDAMN